MPNLRTRLTGVQALLSGMNLQSRFLLTIGASSLLLALVVWAVFSSVTARVIDRIGVRFAEKQVLYDKARTLQPLIREVALAQHMADSAVIKRWAANESDARLRAAALAEMEGFRKSFQDGSFFLALTGSGHYYFNDARNAYAGKELRYTLQETNPADAWFYATIRSGHDYHINVDPEPMLGVTKVWINVLLRDGGKVLGVIGTGLDLSDFIRNVADINQPGITNLFVDRDGAIQIYRDVQYIDFSSIAKSADKRRSIDQLLESPNDQAWVRQAIALADGDGRAVPTGVVRIKGKRYLAGVAALPEVGWYDLTLLDLDVLLPQHDFRDMALAVGAAVLGILLVLAFTLHRLVLRPVAKLTAAAARVAQGDFAHAGMEHGGGEVGQLAAQFNSMTDSIQKTQNWLEDTIAKHTWELLDAKRMLEISLEQEKAGREAQVNLLALMAHEVRSPVAVIGNTAQMLKAMAASEKPEWLPRIDKIMVAVRQLALLMDEVLADERIGLKSRGLERKRGDLNVFCSELRSNQMALRGRAIVFEPVAGDATIYADWQLIKIAVSNLIDNAEKYSPSGSEIVLRVRRVEPHAMSIEVQDRGAPIVPELQARIFEKFIRGPHDGEAQGVGLGLYLVSWIVRLHGGRAEVVAAEDGNTFRLVLPQR